MGIKQMPKQDVLAKFSWTKTYLILLKHTSKSSFPFEPEYDSGPYLLFLDIFDSKVKRKTPLQYLKSSRHLCHAR